MQPQEEPSANSIIVEQALRAAEGSLLIAHKHAKAAGKAQAGEIFDLAICVGAQSFVWRMQQLKPRTQKER